MDFIAKDFYELSTDELYEILRSRSEIFLLEQGIVCQDLDGRDRECLHCFFKKDVRAVAYLRAFRSGDGEVTVGRVLTLEHRHGLGTQLMNKSLEEIKKRFGAVRVCLHSQKQAEGFYLKLGFETVSDEYLEAGIPHVTMEKYI